MTGNSLHKVREVADHFRVTNRTVIDWVRRGRLTAVRLASGQLRIPDEAFQKLIHPIPVQKRRTKRSPSPGGRSKNRNDAPAGSRWYSI